VAGPLSISGSGVNGQGALINSDGWYAGTAWSGQYRTSTQNLTFTGNTTIGGGGRIDIDGALNGGTYTLAKTGSGYLALSVPGCTLGNLDVQQGTVSVEASNTLGDTSGAYSATVEAGAILQFWTNNAGGSSNAKPIVLMSGSGATSGGELWNPNGQNTVNGPITLDDPRGNLVETDSGGSGPYPTTLTINGNVGGPGGLVKGGSATLVLNGSNSYAGGTSIKNGRLVVGVTNALPAATTLTLGDTTGSGGTLDLAGNGQTVTGLAVASGALLADQVIGNSNTSSVGTLTFAGGSSGASTFGGTIQDGLDGGGGPTALAVASGTLTLTGSNVYSGGTSVTGGLLEISSAGALPAGTSLTIGAAAGAVFDAGIGTGTGDAGMGATGYASASLNTGRASGTPNMSLAVSPAAPLAVSPASGGSDVAAVPEPGTLGLLAAALGGVAIAALRKKRR
jgi:autotransporter-associated beta strand protein